MGCPDPVLSKLQADRHFGSVSERFSFSVAKYIEENPDKCLTEEDSEERFKHCFSLSSHTCMLKSTAHIFSKIIVIKRLTQQ